MSRPYFDDSYPHVHIEDLDTIVAVWNGELRGDYYASDDQTWVCLADLVSYHASRHPLLDAPAGDPDHYA